jgi:hypothetical protein
MKQGLMHGSWQRGSRFISCLCIGLVVIADCLFYEQEIGWTAGIYAAVLLGCLLLRPSYFSSAASNRSNRIDILMLIALSGLVWAMIHHPGALTIVMTTIGLISFAIIRRIGPTASVMTWLNRWAMFALIGWRFAVVDSRILCRWRLRTDARTGARVEQCGQEGSQERYGESHDRRHYRWPTLQLAGRFAVQWATPVALSAVFVALFTLANPIIENWVDTTGDQLMKLGMYLPNLIAPWRMLMWMMVGFWGWGLLRFRIRERRGAEALSQGQQSPEPVARHLMDCWLSLNLIFRCLVMFNLLFAAQSLLDVYYLWGGAKLPGHMTYAQYAHRGAYPLLATALLAAAFVLVTFRTRGEAERSRTIRGLVYLWIGQNVLLVLAALWRLGLYVNVYSLTRWRVAAGLWMLLVVLGLASIAWRIIRQRDNRWLLGVNVLATIIVLYTCCFIDFDMHIANYNVRHCREVTGRGPKIDMDYLHEFGEASIPALRWLESQSNDVAVGRKASHLQQALGQQLEAKMLNWRAWTYRRYLVMAQ